MSNETARLEEARTGESAVGRDSVAKCIQLYGNVDAKRALEGGSWRVSRWWEESDHMREPRYSSL